MKKLIIAALCAVTLGASAQETFLFEGRVVNATGIPINNVVVRSVKAGLTVTTGANGLFSLSLPVMEDSIICEKDGLQTYNDCLIPNYNNVIVLTPENSSWMPHEKYVKQMESTAQAYYENGLKFLAGDSANAPNYTKAYACFSRAANMEYTQAAYQLGKMSDEGTGIPQDYEKAISWYKKATNNSKANLRLGIMYMEGIGVQQDYKEAARHFHFAVNQGDTIKAKKYRDELFSKGLAIREDLTDPIPDKVAKFPGGMEELSKWLNKNIRYPKTCIDKAIQGPVILNFVVNADGSISDIKVYRAPDPYLAIEAVRLVEQMPKWEPATVKSTKSDPRIVAIKVRSRIGLPINFRLK